MMHDGYTDSNVTEDRNLRGSTFLNEGEYQVAIIPHIPVNVSLYNTYHDPLPLSLFH